ncbi:Tudor domain-containing protein 7B [Armadillidium vulgare]|nr:Tudor domain-containing protein 7B [Armadillidium vulgare]
MITFVNAISKEFQENIPSNWINEAQKQSVSEIDIQPGPNNMWILSIKEDGPMPVKSASQESSPSSFKSSSVPDPLKLPEDNMWSVFISYIKDCTEIWFRLIEDEITKEYENLVTDMELHYMEENHRKHPTNAVTDAYYVCYHEDSWFRIRLANLTGDVATVFFIDHGDTEEVPVENLYVIEPKFLKFPCQSISASLSGFEFGFSDPEVVASLQNLALGKTLIAEVLSRDENLSVVLYDTTTSEDVNINEELLQMLPKIYPTPKFPAKEGICEAYVSYVKPNGDIFVKIETASFTVLENLFQTAKRSETLDIDMGKLYIAKFGPDGEWCRAAPRSVSQDGDRKLKINEPNS